MSSTPSTDDRSKPVLDSERLPVLEKLLGRRRAESSRFLAAATREGISLQDLWKRLDDKGSLVAAGLLSANPGRTATLLLSPIQNRGHAGETTRLVRDMARHAWSAGNIDLIQYLGDPDDALELGVLQEAGFLQLAVLASMERANIRNARRPAPVAEVELTSETLPDETMLELLQATYEESLDCPGLSELRHDRDILEGHRRGGNFDPRLWTVLRHGGRNVGVAILNRTPAADCIELAYFGLAKHARGKGLGAHLLDHALFLAAKQPERSVLLAVDERNSPALRLYHSRGFRAILRRVAMALSSLKRST
ncbi:MAG: GNAT family N-acetyltransferase [Planctomycetes bacterium]|nr:GNAT family N-acetyltransferase [Planctomycetota bacterium]